MNGIVKSVKNSTNKRRWGAVLSADIKIMIRIDWVMKRVESYMNAGDTSARSRMDVVVLVQSSSSSC